jgi:hypothetical protein
VHYTRVVRGWQGEVFGDYPYLTAEGAVLHCALDASKERREKRKKPFSAFSAQSRAGLHWAQSRSPGATAQSRAGLHWAPGSAAGLPAQPGFSGLWHWVCSAVKGNGVAKPVFELVGNHQEVCRANNKSRVSQRASVALLPCACLRCGLLRLADGVAWLLELARVLWVPSNARVVAMGYLKCYNEMV